ncbi:MAG: PKD domain-containing protein, partial [Candidatus Nanohaloarchaea archaeon]
NSSIQYARDKGSVVVAAAGNRGTYENITAPSSVADTISVGAVDYSGNLAYFSSKGPEPVNKIVKPEVTAPGAVINSTSHQYPSTNYTGSSGTSMATPVVSGVVALAREKNPDWSVEQVENAVIASGSGNKVGDGKNVFERGTGLINASKIVDPELMLSETRFNYGNISALKQHTETLTLKNTASGPRNYSIDSEIHMYNTSSETVENGDANIGFNQSSVYLEPGEQKDVELYLEINDEHSMPYGGLARFKADESYSILVGGYTNDAAELEAKLSLNASTIGLNETLEADGSASIPEDTIESYSYAMGDSDTLNGEKVEHSYNSSGNYTVELEVSGDGLSDTDTEQVEVEDLEPPEASLTANNSEPEASKEEVEFDASGSTDNIGVSYYLYDLDGDGSYERNTTSNTSKTFENPGSVNVTVKVFDEAGNSDTSSVTVNVSDETLPQPVIDANTTDLNIGDDVLLNGSNSSDNTGIVEYNWSLKNKTESLEAFTESFESPGTFNVTLEAEDDYGNSNSTSTTLNVSDETPPEALIDIEPENPELGEEASFSAENSSDNVGIEEYRWDLQNDSTIEHTSENFSQAFDSKGNYTVKLEAEDSSNNTDTAFEQFFVNDTTPPEIKLNLENSFPQTDEEFTINASNTSDNDFVKNISYDFGNATATGETAAHSYSQEGLYTVTVEASDNSSNTATKNVDIQVKDFNATIESPEQNISSKDQQLKISFTRNVSDVNATLNSSEISLKRKDNRTFTSDLYMEEGLHNLSIEAIDRSNNSLTREKQFENMIKPEINSFNVSEKLTPINSTVKFKSNVSEDNHNSTLLELEKPSGNTTSIEMTNSSSLENSTERTAELKADEEGVYNSTINIEDTFGNKNNETLQFEASNPVKVGVSYEPDQNLSSKFTGPYGREKKGLNSSELNTSLPSSENYTTVFEDDKIRVKLDSTNLSQNVSGDLYWKHVDPDIDSFNAYETLAVEQPFNFSQASIRADLNAEDVYRCSSFSNGSCGSDWEKINEKIVDSGSSTEIRVDAFSAFSFGEEESDSSDSGGSSDSDSSSESSESSQGISGGGFTPELEIVEEEDRVFIYNIYEGQRVKLNGTGLPLNAIEFGAGDNESIEIEKVEANSSRFQTGLSANSSLESFELEFEIDEEWMDSRMLEPGDISIFREEALTTELVDREELLYSAEIGSGRYMIGSRTSCGANGSVDAVLDSCETYENRCSVPENAEIVESCQIYEERERVERLIEQKRQERGESEQLDQASQLLESGRVQDAAEKVEGLESSDGSSSILWMVLVFGAVGLSVFGVKLYRVRRKRVLLHQMQELTRMLKELQDQGRDIGAAAEKLGEANQALRAGDYGKAREATSQVRQMLKV